MPCSLAYIMYSLSPVQVIAAELRASKHWELTAEGEEIAEQGSHEARVLAAIPPEGLAQSDLMVSQEFTDLSGQ